MHVQGDHNKGAASLDIIGKFSSVGSVKSSLSAELSNAIYCVHFSVKLLFLLEHRTALM